MCSAAVSMQKHPNIRTNWNKRGVMEAPQSGPAQAVEAERCGQVASHNRTSYYALTSCHDLMLTSL